MFIVLKPLARLVSRATGARLLVFIFHRILDRPDELLPGEPDARQFDWMVRLIAANFDVLPFGAAVRRLQRGELGRPSACVTFDDGYMDNLTVALPILKRHGIPATFFVATGFLEGDRMWSDDICEAVRKFPGDSVDLSRFDLGRHDLRTAADRALTVSVLQQRLKYLPHGERSETARALAHAAGLEDISRLMLDRDGVRALRAAGMEIGAHTHTHPILKGLGGDEAYAEIVRSRLELEHILSEPVDVFAYPNGDPQLDIDSSHPEMLRRAGFSAAATTQRGVGRAGTDPYMMPRFTPWDRTPARFAGRCALALAGYR
jgi:peptidoglycan/xylan/chitin deacetylase (PgdA/CDA1 family)